MTGTFTWPTPGEVELFVSELGRKNAASLNFQKKSANIFHFVLYLAHINVYLLLISAHVDVIETKTDQEERALSFQIGQRILAKINDKGWDQSEFATRSGYERTKVNKWIKGKTKIGLSDLKRISEVLSTSLSELFGEKLDKFEVSDPQSPAYLAYKLLKGLPPEMQRHYHGVFFLIDQHEKRPNLNLSLKE